MSTNFPTALDTLTNPTPTDYLNSPSHAGQHANANDAIEALEAKVGINSSAVTTSHDYKLGEVTGTDKAVGKTATQTLENKTLTSPVIGAITNTDHITITPGTSKLVKLAVLTRTAVGTSSYINNTVILCGNSDFTLSNASSADASVSFGITFSSDPFIVASSSSDGALIGNMNAEIYNRTTTGFSIRLRDTDATLRTATGKAQWIAIGQLN